MCSMKMSILTYFAGMAVKFIIINTRDMHYTDPVTMAFEKFGKQLLMSVRSIIQQNHFAYQIVSKHLRM